MEQRRGHGDPKVNSLPSTDCINHEPGFASRGRSPKRFINSRKMSFLSVAVIYYFGANCGPNFYVTKPSRQTWVSVHFTMFCDVNCEMKEWKAWEFIARAELGKCTFVVCKMSPYLDQQSLTLATLQSVSNAPQETTNQNLVAAKTLRRKMSGFCQEQLHK